MAAGVSFATFTPIRVISPPNSTLTYQVNNPDTVIIDPITGNPSFGSTVTVTITVSLEASRRIEDFRHLIGVDSNGILLEGRLSSHPNTLKPGMSVNLVFNDGRQGTLYVLPTIATDFSDLFGYKITGIYHQA